MLQNTNGLAYRITFLSLFTNVLHLFDNAAHEILTPDEIKRRLNNEVLIITEHNS